MKSKLFGKKAVVISVLSVVILLISAVLINIFLVAPKLNNRPQEIIEPQRTVYNGFMYQIVTMESGDKEVFINTYTGDEVNVIVPDKIEGITVTHIDSACFMDESDIESIEFPESINVIGADVFKNCTSLKKVIIHNPEAFLDTINGLGLDANTVVYAPSGSTAEKYCKDKNISFDILEK